MTEGKSPSKRPSESPEENRSVAETLVITSAGGETLEIPLRFVQGCGFDYNSQTGVLKLNLDAEKVETR